MQDLKNKNFHCVIDLAIHFIGGKWKMVILWYLIDEKKRFSELNKLIPAITEKMLSIQLKSLEEDGIIKREVYTTKPPLKVEYSLTDFGKSLVPLLQSVNQWGHQTLEAKNLSLV